MSDPKETATNIKYIKGEQIKTLAECEGLELAVANYEGKNRLIDPTYQMREAPELMESLVNSGCVFRAVEYKGLNCTECVYCQIQHGRYRCFIGKTRTGKNKFCEIGERRK